MRTLLLSVAGACLLGSGCRYLENRADDFVDCFQASVGAGLGLSAHVRIGPAAVGAGAWWGHAAGLERHGRAGAWEETSIGLPLTLVVAPVGISIVNSISPTNTGLGPPAGLLVSQMEMLDRNGSEVGGELRSEISFWLWTVPDIPQLDNIPWTDYFWVEASARVLFGVRAGFNIAEFADFLLGWFGIDIAGDDRRQVVEADLPAGSHGAR